MSKKLTVSTTMRIVHRYLGFFLAGIMAVYALSGIVLIFRDTSFLKNEKQIVKTVAPNATEEKLGKLLEVKRLKVDREEGDVLYFKDGTYNKKTGVANYKTKELPVILEKMEHLHKAKTGDPLFFLNVFFGLSLLFFVLSSFWMFMPKTSIFKKGLYFTAAGIVLTVILLFV
ncbi:PepSY domain-containing protein [Flavobacterium muglaense]|uniref:PepSY domain-containing protein n=1 Tax=Flavobacterium muglaense TaxID=2764716 RepID=A0A923SK95_9FLAO|nr:PepSY domain-containing protein [Flavobacterium muglaense]MBC5838534.1 PepSY domain-containing protein [Flavobacterium muglaense]MBC5845068.1 PepSY domain-containing protein [Flavobacterium muglaense]